MYSIFDLFMDERTNRMKKQIIILTVLIMSLFVLKANAEQLCPDIRFGDQVVITKGFYGDCIGTVVGYLGSDYGYKIILDKLKNGTELFTYQIIYITDCEYMKVIKEDKL